MDYDRIWHSLVISLQSGLIDWGWIDNFTHIFYRVKMIIHYRSTKFHTIPLVFPWWHKSYFRAKSGLHFYMLLGLEKAYGYVGTIIIAKDFSVVKSRLALGPTGWLFVCHHAENGLIHRKIVVDCPLLITSTIGQTLFQTRKDYCLQWYSNSIPSYMRSG